MLASAVLTRIPAKVRERSAGVRWEAATVSGSAAALPGSCWVMRPSVMTGNRSQQGGNWADGETISSTGWGREGHGQRNGQGNTCSRSGSPPDAAAGLDL